ncbi:MAG: chorismate mutase [Candidatus Marinimicrobia bacterium]|nr:chorismate mutase [Candidatus Neomarinimicrobiota bacterium]MCF7828339.1 chorismate mutase [Candidatus Neomarinimicrobiota bacterium]MCF7879486.1 chorismate mutase [Candidatus Neomarinimicrobiota bacterium]
MCMRCQGVRGATTIEANEREAILAGTRELLTSMVDENGIDPDDIASVIFTTSSDVNAEYPAVAARNLGWYDQALLCGHEMDVPGGLKKCIRILLHWNTEKSIGEIQHVYLNGAESLRPERALDDTPASR